MNPPITGRARVARRSRQTKTTQNNSIRHFDSLGRLLAIMSFIAVLAISIYSTSSVSLTGARSKGNAPVPVSPNARKESARNLGGLASTLTVNELLGYSNSASMLPVFPQAAPGESVTTYDGTACTVLRQNFLVGETVCAKAANLSEARRIYWISPDGYVVQTDDVDTNNPSGTRVVNQVGNWRVYLVSAQDGTLRDEYQFSVSDAAQPQVDLAVAKFTDPGDFTAGSIISYHVVATNKGPDVASSVSMTESVPNSTTLVSSSQDSGLPFICNTAGSSTTCTIASLPANSSASFTFVYQIAGGTPAGTVISNTASISSTTPELHAGDNSATNTSTVMSGAAAPDCTLDCPNNIVVTATTHGAGGGANVTFASPEGFGSCGTITSNPASGSFFPIGTTTVTNTSETGGGFCSFTVTVLDTAAPTISCPPNISVTANVGETTAYVPDPNGSSSNVGTPTATGTNILVTGSRDDGEALTSAYPVGNTIITWTATEYETDPQQDPNAQPTGRSASCQQSITVLDATPLTISCPPDQTVTAPSGSCEATVDPGTATASSPTATITGERSDSLPLTDPYPAGITHITWTATEGGKTASCTQTITVNANDTEAPTLHVPANVSATTSSCTATLDDELGVATAEDNCSTSVSIKRTGVPTVACPTPGNPNRQCESFVFPTGTTTITYTATDAAGNIATGTQLVTVTESPAVPPTVTAPNDVSVNTGAGATSCGAFVSDATLGNATASDNCPGVTVVRSGVPAGNIFPVGPTTVTYTATDASGNTAYDTQTVTVVDNTAPVITPPAAVTLYTGPGATSCSVTVSDLDATLGTGSATDNCPGLGAITRSGVPSGNTFPLGNTTVTYSVTDAHGNSSSGTQVVTVVDNTPPTISCPSNVTVTLPSNSTATSMVVNYPAATASDNCAGPVNITYSKASGTVFPVGPTTVTATATDAHGNSASCTFTVTVLYNFTGFFSPVGNTPTLNAVNAGRAIPVKFSLSGNKGLNIFAANNPYSVSMNCATNDPGVDVTETLNAGGSSLSYDAGSGIYNYVWKTESSWAGTCRQLVVTLNDGSVHIAYFKFK